MKQGKLFLGMLCLVLATMLVTVPALADTPTPSPTTPTAGTDNTSNVCTTFSQRMAAMTSTDTTTPTDSSSVGLLSDIYNYITEVVGTATQTLFSAFTSNDDYQDAVYAAITLMIVFYGVGFTIGVVQANFSTVLIRLVKIGVIGAVISPDGWTFFSQTVVSFFSDGTDDIIKGVMSIGTGMPTPDGATPFYQIDKIATFIMQPDTIIQIMGSTFAGGPFSIGMGALMGFAMWGFCKLLINALQNYAVCYVARALVLGVAPIFIVFLLFDKTSQMFKGWVNVLLNFSLQPILLFTFLSFFITLISSATQSIFKTDLCWSEFQGVTGSTVRPAFWRFKDPTTGAVDLSKYDWQGSITCRLKGDTSSCPSFPVNIVDILSFLILVYVAQRFAAVIERISTELSQALVTLDPGGKMDQYLQNQVKGTPSSGDKNPPASGAPPRPQTLPRPGSSQGQ